MVHTVSQLEEAVRSSVREVMVVGMLAPKMLGMTTQDPAVGKFDALSEACFSRLKETFNVVEIRDSSKNVIVVLTQRS